jgi:hypothetical protein
MVSLLILLLLIITVIIIVYTNHRIIVRDLRHDVANKDFHYAVLVELSKILEREKLDHLLIEATENVKKPN